MRRRRDSLQIHGLTPYTLAVSPSTNIPSIEAVESTPSISSLSHFAQNGESQIYFTSFRKQRTFIAREDAKRRQNVMLLTCVSLLGVADWDSRSGQNVGASSLFGSCVDGAIFRTL
ncbi:hypothetical protein NL676_012191 [Syzygium grande]|nr:hypothetical protein NL676_012191 [Syzygium grande]